MNDPRERYKPIGDNPDPVDEAPPLVDPDTGEMPIGEPARDDVTPLPRSTDDNPAHDGSAAPDD